MGNCAELDGEGRIFVSQSRRRDVGMAAIDKLTIAGADVPFPGIGHVVKAGAAYAYEPLFWASG